MPKPFLIKEDELLEHSIIETMLAGLKQWRPDLEYPESHSDMQACVRGVLKMFHVQRRPLVQALRIRCHACEGLGHQITEVEGRYRKLVDCVACKGMGYIEGD